MTRRYGSHKNNTCAACGTHIDKSDASAYHCTIIVSSFYNYLPVGQVKVVKRGRYKGEERDYEEVKGSLLTFCSHCYITKLLSPISDAQNRKKED